MNDKGVSEVIGVILIVAITVAIASAVYVFVIYDYDYSGNDFIIVTGKLSDVKKITDYDYYITVNNNSYYITQFENSYFTDNYYIDTFLNHNISIVFKMLNKSFGEIPRYRLMDINIIGV